MVNISRFRGGLVMFFMCFGFTYEIACRDEREKDVDWYVNYKIPKIEEEPAGSNLHEGKAYAYITSSGTESWKLSTKSITSGSMLETTLKNFYANKQGLSYLFYNDETPPSYNGTTVGHLKGVVAFDGNSGYWLIHSIPKFADDKTFLYPDNAYVYGQSVLCVTFRTTELNEICNQLLYNHPNIYAYGITDEVKVQLDDKAKTLFTDKPSFLRKPLTRMTNLKSLGNKPFVSFAKDNQYNYDIYSDIMAPGLNTSLMSETWRRGSGSYLPPSCQSEYYVLDIVSINMSFTDSDNTKNIAFKSTDDHSKWAISDGNQNWVCIGDMNRMLSQEKRGGGSLCFQSDPVNNAYRSVVSDTDHCPT